MGLRSFRTMDSFSPMRGSNLKGDRNKYTKIGLGQIKSSKVLNVFRAPDWVRITRITILSDTAVPSSNSSFWTFRVQNMSHVVSTELQATPANTTASPITADTPLDIIPDQNDVLAPGDVLAVNFVKAASAQVMTYVEVWIDYEVTNQTTTTSSSTTSTTTTTTTTSSSTSTSTSVSTSSSTSTSSTTVTTTSTSTSSTTTSTTTVSTSTSTTTTSSSTTSTTTTTTTLSTSTTTT